MRHVRELLEDATRVGEVVTGIDDHYAHGSFRIAARQAGAPTRSITRLALGEVAAVTDVDTEAARLAPALAQWMVRHAVDVVLSPGHLSRRASHQTAHRAIMLAAMRAADIMQQKVSVLAAHGTDVTPGIWSVEPGLAVTEATPSAASYSRHQVNPGILSSESVEHHFATPTDE